MSAIVQPAPSTLVAEVPGAAVHCCDWRALLDVVPACDLLCVDAPYSEKTHRGHDTGVIGAADVAVYANGSSGRDRERRYALRKLADGVPRRRAIEYPAWTPEDVRAFVAEWHPRTRGWFVSLTDDVLAPVWLAAFESVGRYAFAPLPYVAPGSRVRLTGDGPSAWTCWIVVARPRTPDFVRWGTLPGAYVLPPGQAERMPVVGGKPPWLLCRLLEDYSRLGDLCVDPCGGAGTLAAAALRTGRRAIVGDLLRAHADLAALWIKHPHRPAPRADLPPAGGQSAFRWGE